MAFETFLRFASGGVAFEFGGAGEEVDGAGEGVLGEAPVAEPEACGEACACTAGGVGATGLRCCGFRFGLGTTIGPGLINFIAYCGAEA